MRRIFTTEVFFLEKEYLLSNISRASMFTKKLESINQDLEFLHSPPIGKKMFFFYLAFFNFAWVSFFVTLGLHYPITLFSAPIVLWFLRGSKITGFLNQHFLNRKLVKNEQKIHSLLKEKSEIIDEIKSIVKISEDYFSTETLKKFETYIKDNKASSLEDCIQLYRKEEIAN